MLSNLKAGQRYRVRFTGGQTVEGTVKAANAAMACFEPEAGMVIVLRRNLHLQVPVWSYNRMPVEISEIPVMPRGEFRRRLAELEQRTRFIVEGK